MNTVMDVHYPFMQRCLELGAMVAAEGESPVGNVAPCALCAYVIRHHRISRVVFTKTCGQLGGTARFNVLTVNDITAWGTAPEVIVYPA